MKAHRGILRSFVPVVCSLWLTSSVALAQQSSGAMAEALFRDGRALMAAGDLGAACPKFAESNRIDPKLGTLMNLALCHEKSGRSASAWAEYTDAATLAQRAGQSEREEVARARAAELEPTLPHVVIDADPKSGAVALDDQPIGPAAYRTPIPVDPGPHVLRATATGMTPFEQSFSVAQAASTTLKVPALEPVPARGPEAPHASEEASAPAAPTASSMQRTVGFVVGGAGVVLAGLGAYFGARAFSDKNAAENGCGATFCTAAGNDATNAMKTDETLSTIGVIAGIAAVGVGISFVLWSPGERSASPSAGHVSFDVAPRGLRARVSW
jgi:hypothetical protein